jgi:hypothetical protein
MTPGHELPDDVNCSILLAELPLLEAGTSPPAAAGYRGWVGLEYIPYGPSADSFGWLPRERRQGGAP